LQPVRVDKHHGVAEVRQAEQEAIAVAMRWWKNGLPYATVSLGRNPMTGQRSASTNASEWIVVAQTPRRAGHPERPRRGDPYGPR
jgi:hypothetical protein